jgi:hypothetical protein
MSEIVRENERRKNKAREEKKCVNHQVHQNEFSK